MNIFLTGATGFIGSHFVNQALAAGHAVLALRRNETSWPRIPLLQQPKWLDRSLDQVASQDLRGCDVLVHLAAHTGNVPYDNLHNCLRWNLMAVLQLFAQAHQAGIQHFVVAGTCFEYGRSGERFDSIPTDAPLEPSNSYAASKAAASIALRQWASDNCCALTILRVFHVFGEGEPESRFWPSLRRAALAGEDFPMSKGEQIRDFIRVDKVAAAFLQQCLLSLATPTAIHTLNLGSGSPLMLREFAEYWWRAFNAKGHLLLGESPYREGEVMRYVAGPDLIQLGPPF